MGKQARCWFDRDLTDYKQARESRGNWEVNNAPTQRNVQEHTTGNKKENTGVYKFKEYEILNILCFLLIRHNIHFYFNFTTTKSNTHQTNRVSKANIIAYHTTVLFSILLMLLLFIFVNKWILLNKNKSKSQRDSQQQISSFTNFLKMFNG